MNAFKDIEQKAQGALLKGEQGAKAWFGTNWVPFGAGVALAELLNLIVRHF